MTPCSHSVDSCEGIVRTVIAGRVGLQQCYDATAAVMSDRRVGSTMRHLVDIRKMDYIPSVRESIEFSNLLISKRTALQSKIAVVFSDPLLGGLVRLACDYVRIMGVPMHAFRSMDEAHDWLTEDAYVPLNGQIRKAS